VRFDFGGYPLDVGRHELRRGTDRIGIEPQAIDLTTYLTGREKFIGDTADAKKPGAICPGPSARTGEPALRLESYFLLFFFLDFLYMPPPGFSFRNMPPPGFSLRWASCMSSVDIRGLNAGVSVAVELAAWADSDMATRPAAPRSAVRTNFMMNLSGLGISIVLRHNEDYSFEGELKMNSWKLKLFVILERQAPNYS